MNPLPPDLQRAIEPTPAEIDALVAPLQAAELRFAALSTEPTAGELRLLRQRLPRQVQRRTWATQPLALMVAAVLLLWWARPAPPQQGTGEEDRTAAAVAWSVGEERLLSASLALSASIGVEAAPTARLRLVQQDAAGARLLLVDGAATFEVDPAGLGRDLRVVAGEVEVRVTGTRFAVRHGGAWVEVAVGRGHVAVHHPGGVTALGQGEVLRWPPPMPVAVGPVVVAGPGTPIVSPAPIPDPDATHAAAARSWAALLDDIGDDGAAAAITKIDQWLAASPAGALADEARVHRLLLQAEAGDPIAALLAVDAWLQSHPASPSFPRVHLLRAELLVGEGRCTEARASFQVVEAQGTQALRERAQQGRVACEER